MTRIDTIIFDWDGTLIDSAQGAFNAFQKAFLDLGIVVEFEKYEKIYSPDWYLMYEALRLPVDKWQLANDRWLHHYGGETPQLVTGGREALEQLVRKNYCLGIVTSGSRDRVRREIDALGLQEVFQTVVCSDDVVNRKPHPEGLLNAMTQLGKEPGCCCYVGDSPDDIKMGRRASVLTVAIPGSYPTSRKLRAAQPDLWCESLGQLLDYAGLRTVELRS